VAAHGPDIFDEPDGDPDTLSNLGPLRPMAGVWEGADGVDAHPVEGGTEEDPYVERYELQPIDRQTNGPQLFYGLRYHTHIVKPGQIETFHDQVGYWLWEPATETVTFTLAIPRGQVLLASGPAAADASRFEITAQIGSEVHGILSNPFLDQEFRTTAFRMAVTTHPNGTWSYEQETLLEVADRAGEFRHTDRNTLRRIAPPQPNPLALAALGVVPAAAGSLGLGSLRSTVLPR
jgi:hypothetical protein